MRLETRTLPCLLLRFPHHARHRRSPSRRLRRSIPRRPNALTSTVLAFSNDAGAMISVMQGGTLPPVDSVADAMAAAMAPKIDEVIGSGVVDLGGTRWGRLEFMGRLDDDRVHSVHYMAPFQGQGVVVAFTSRAGDPELRAQLARSAASLEMADCALVPVDRAGGR
jgi:hypothetical protein